MSTSCCAAPVARSRASCGSAMRTRCPCASVRIPLLDPDAFLERWSPWVSRLFSWPAAVVWAVAVLAAAVGIVVHWHELTHDASSQLLDPRNLVLMAFAYPVVKAIHEFGHAFATKAWGGEVHEMGITFLVFMPVPYVDASAASVFPEKWRRVTVGAAGIMVELALAAGAFAVWSNAEPGLVRLLAYDVMWIGAASTLLINGNPLLRFDAYYVLADAIEIPNLGPRSQQFLSYLTLRHLFGLEDVRHPVGAPREGGWLLAYGVLSFVYRFVVLFGIALFVSGRFFVLGQLIAVFALVMGVFVPLGKKLGFLFTNPRLGERRTRALLVSAGGAAALAFAVGVVPMPLMTRAEGVIWPPDGAHVRARADGFVLRVLVRSDDFVREGEALILTRDPSLEARVAVLEAELRELHARHYQQQRDDLVRAQLTEEEIATAQATLARARERIGDIVIRSPLAGRFVAPGSPVDLPGRFVRQGDLLGYVLDDSVRSARIVVAQSDIALVRERTRGIRVRLSSRLSEEQTTTIRRAVPAATHRLPSAALGTLGGGAIAVDPSDPEGLQTLARVFQLDVDLPPDVASPRVGERVYVRFDHGAEPVAARLYRSLRRLFLRQLGA